MTRFSKYAFYTLTLAMGMIPIFYYFDYNMFLIFLITLNINTLLLGLSGVFDKKTYKPLGYEVLGLAAIILGSVYVVFSLCFAYIIVGLFFNIISSHELVAMLPYLSIIGFILVLLYIFLPENQDIKFGITKPWGKGK